MAQWTISAMPSQKGKTAIVTGTGGIGYECALALAKEKAQVIIAGRNSKKGAEAVAKIKTEVPHADVSFEIIDLADLQSVKHFAQRLQREQERVDLLINNAAIMNPPTRMQSQDGLELQFATNYLSHFALTGLLLPLLRKAEEPRIVTVSSIASRQGKIDFGDLQSKVDYVPMKAYSQSKLACLMFALELERKSNEHGWGITSIGAHPGVCRTELLHNAPGKLSPQGIFRSLFWFMFQPAAQGALPVLYAATASNARPGGYYGPGGIAELNGYPVPAKIPVDALNASTAAKLWEESERLTGGVFAAQMMPNA
jgi:NAD(P)-dependent dehydrogenase (short-subunit alcohol dehydrogenase family)